MGFSKSVNFTFKSNVEAVKAAVKGKLDEAFDAVKDASVEWVHDQMLHGYHDPHGPDGHTEIYDTGALYDSIKAEVTTKALVMHKAEVGSNKDYAVFVHNGTRKLRGRPFIRDALEKNAKYYEYIIRDKLNEIK